jgi:cytochrome c-type biogenesis protein CcmE
MTSRTIKILLTVAVIGGGAGVLLFSSLSETMAYYKHVEEVTAAPASFEGKDLQVHGYVAAGSLNKRIEGHVTRTDFVIESGGERIAVTTTAIIPDTFKETGEVVAKGKLVKQSDGSYDLHADEIVAKCPSKYEQNQRTKTLAGPG